ncbi:cytoplasmic tRNA 2-thiolation protein 2 [Electrophorus electricus]|uniref:Cytoplasmic tRNA 2-thiolation protein 2 n=1 Tax=Electrophorus electricus TaxID=8005 RepID=A0A4W4GZI2_ELEEL|nr:cytoplasmic tRNA 2-thiolation protein 2 [Electrophorus electricus]
MCQVEEEYSGPLEKTSLPTVSKKCMKCKESTAVLIIRVGDAFCRDCFREYFVHKFRAMLGKNRVIFPGEKVLLAVSGGPASSSMLTQVQEGLSRDAPKKLRFAPGIIYIDEGGACDQNAEEREKTLSQMEAIFRKTGFPYHIVSLEQVFSLPNSVLEPVSCGPERPGSSYKAAVDQYLQQKEVNQRQGQLATEEAQDAVAHLSVQASQVSPEHKQALEKLFSSLKTLTARQDMLQTLRQHLILHTARLNGYSKVMMGDSCTRLAIRLLSNISLGRGASLAVDTGFSDPRYGDVVIVRPMRDYSSKEIAFYNRLFGVRSLFISGLGTKTSDKASIQQLTESFVIKLQADFPSTVSTIYRTSEKLHTACPPQTSGAVAADKCLLCLCAVCNKADAASASHASLISERLSRGELGMEAKIDPASCCPSGTLDPFSCQREGQGCGEGGSCTAGRAPAPADLKSLLCYSCRLTVKDMAAEDTLPPYITSEAEKRWNRAQLKEEVREFLLEDEDEEVG